MQTDPVIEAAEAALTDARAKVEFAEKRLAGVRSRIVRWSGDVRLSASTEAAARSEELEALKERAKLRERELEAARADLPRRDRERKRAEKLAKEAGELATKVEATRAALAETEAAHAGKLADHDAALASASRVEAA